jgi:Galactose oxidase, central domain
MSPQRPGRAAHHRPLLILCLGVLALAGAMPASALATAPDAEWTQQSPTTSPSPRMEFPMAYDPATSQIVVFGGEGNGGVLGDTWTYDGSEWTQQQPTASPSSREYGSMAYDPDTGEMLMFGGWDEQTALTSETWAYNGTTWTQQHPANSPPPRFGASMQYDAAAHEMVLFGGYVEGFSRAGDTWVYNGSNWSELHPASSPPSRAGAAMTYDPAIGEIVLFGGDSSTGTSLGDTWTFNGSSWTEQHPASSPEARYYSVMAYDPRIEEPVLFSGVTVAPVVGSEFGEAILFTDTWTYNGSSWIERSTAQAPSGRVRGGLAYDPSAERMVLFGGLGEGRLNDTWTLRAKSLPTLSVKASGEIQLGGSLHDDASLTRGISPGGTITFRLYGPDDGSCASTPVYTSSPIAVSGDGAYQSGSFSPSSPGVYRWVASYSGDLENGAVAGVCGEAEQSVTVAAPGAPAPTPTPGTPAPIPTPGPPVSTAIHAPQSPATLNLTRAVVPTDVRIIGAGDTVAVHGNKAVVPITCRSTSACTGVVDLQSRAYSSAASSTYSHAHYAIAAGRTTAVTLTLGGSAMGALARHKRERAYLYIHPSTGLPAGTLYVGGEVRLVLRAIHAVRAGARS